MNWRQWLIRLSIVLTVLWGVASFFIGGNQLSDAMKIYSAMDSDWDSIYSQLRQSYALLAAIYWVGGAAIWWALLYVGFWVASGFKGKQ